MTETCPFCEGRTDSDQLSFNDLAYTRLDNFPISPGHLLIIPKRHAADWFDLSPAEQQAVMALIEEGKSWLEAHHRPHGYNIGMNCGKAAGQTVMHMHCHLIPRYEGDREDPRGGVRWVMPEKADYWSEQ